MNTRFLTRIGLGVATSLAFATTSAVSVGAANVAANPSPAATGQALTAIKGRCNTAVQNRETALTNDASRINGAANLTSSDKTALLSVQSNDASGLTALDATIQADTTWQQAHSDCEKIVDDYHVYVLFKPQVHIVIAADTVSSVDSEISSLATQLQQKLGSNTNPTVQAALADLTKQAAGAQSAVSGVSAAVLALTPSGYPANKTTLQSGFSSISTARGDLEQARADIEMIRNALEGSATPSPSA